ncbi:hypothetical protein [Salipiger bermudensis]|uniref:hypothetical protein n=1 Tax=Salipiger bermudensis TaxID=344736 RepID=UPI001CD7B1F7|nr:hypothetical protein [Salipiger bermudensis]MCA1285031.1 hypothetical protein [Salipiger bermudensis]
MIARIAKRLLRRPRYSAFVPLDTDGRQRAETLREALESLAKDPYLMLADPAWRLVSVFDDLRYDRADMDMMTGPMRAYATRRLEPLGFRQATGSILENSALDIRMHIPRFRALGASPFDAVRDTPRRAQDYYLLTPTQTAAQFVLHYPVETAVERIKTLVARQPVNLLRLSDYLEQRRDHQDVLSAIGHLKYVQRMAVESEPLRRRRALR